MSHIFDALQKSAAEQGGIEVPSWTLAAELLEATERKTAAEWAKTAVPDFQVPEAELDVMAALRSAVDSAVAETRPSAYCESPALTRTTDQFSQFQSLRVLVPPQSRIVCITEKDSLAAEKFRYLSVRLRHIQQSRPLKKLLITSTIPQEGKSMVAANLACALAQQMQHKTLLIDGDLRRPTVDRLFGLGKISGLGDWLQGDRGACVSIYHLEDAGLFALPAGNIPRNPLELMQAGKLSLLMEQLASWFEWIVIDSPPVLPLADTSVWTRVVDGTLLVTRQGKTRKRQLKRGLEMLDRSSLLGIVINDYNDVTQHNYYQQYGYNLKNSKSETSKLSP